MHLIAAPSSTLFIAFFTLACTQKVLKKSKNWSIPKVVIIFTFNKQFKSDSKVTFVKSNILVTFVKSNILTVQSLLPLTRWVVTGWKLSAVMLSRWSYSVRITGWFSTCNIIKSAWQVQA